MVWKVGKLVMNLANRGFHQYFCGISESLQKAALRYVPHVCQFLFWSLNCARRNLKYVTFPCSKSGKRAMFDDFPSKKIRRVERGELFRGWVGRPKWGHKTLKTISQSFRLKDNMLMFFLAKQPYERFFFYLVCIDENKHILSCFVIFKEH